MGSIHREALRESACNTLETLAFTELIDLAGSELPSGEERMGARITLGEDGVLDLYLSRRLLEEVAATLFCLDPQNVDSAVIKDTLLEIANIIAGRYLAKLRDGKTDFNLGLPEMLEDASRWHDHPVRLTLESGPERQLALGLMPSRTAA